MESSRRPRCGDGGVWGLWGAAGGAQRVFGLLKGGVRGLRGAGLPSELRRVSIVACGEGEGPHRTLGISRGVKSPTDLSVPGGEGSPNLLV